MATAREHIAEAEELLAAYQAGVRMARQPGVDFLPGDILTIAQMHTDMANVRLQIERLDRAAAAEQLLADLKPSPRSLDPHHNQKNGTRRRNTKKPTNDEGPAASPTGPSAWPPKGST